MCRLFISRFFIYIYSSLSAHASRTINIDFVIIPSSCLFFNKLSNYLISFRVLYLLLGGRGFWPVVGRGVLFSVLVVFFGWPPEWGHLVNLGLGSGCSGPFGSRGLCPALVSW